MGDLAQLSFAPLPPVALHEVDRRTANDLLTRFGHYLGPCNRPFGQQAWALLLGEEPVAVAVSASTVSRTIRSLDGREWNRRQLVELARLAASERWVTRVMLRLWREVCAPSWPHWQATAAVAYSQNDRHEGRIYRFDGWTKASDRAGSSGGGTWSTKRAEGDAVRGAKTLWIWEYVPAPSSPSLGSAPNREDER